MDDEKMTDDKNFFCSGNNLSQGEKGVKFYPSGDFSNDDDDDDGWRERQKNVHFTRASRLFVHFLPLLHNYDVEMPNYEFLLRM